MCAALHVTRQGYHAWRKRPPSAHDLRDAELAAAISEIYTASRGIYGVPKVFQELKKAGVRTSRKRVARIMRDNGWAGATRGCAKRPEGGAEQAAPQADSAPDLVRRDFSADGPNRARFAGIRPSTGSIASPRDDAAMGSPMGPVEAECAHARAFETRDQAALGMFDCIECSCNRVRIHSAPGNLSPEGFEARHAQEAASAA